MNTTRACTTCRGGGYVDGTYGFGACDECAGCGTVEARLCDFCHACPAADVVDREHGNGTAVCAACLPLTVSDTCWLCMGDDAVPIAMHEGLALCAACWTDARRQTTQPPPPAPDTLPCMAYPEAANDSVLEAELGASLAIVEAAHEADMEPAGALKMMRRAAARKVVG